MTERVQSYWLGAFRCGVVWLCIACASLTLFAQTPARESPPTDGQQTSDEAILAAYGKRNISVHDPSAMVQSGDKFWLFSTGNLVSSWWSDDRQVWHRGPKVFAALPGWVPDVVPDHRGHFWAPDIIQTNDRYLLYYSVSSFGKNTSAIALASTPTLDPEDDAYGWTDHGIVIQSSAEDDFNAIDPAIILTESGELWMAFGSYWSGLKLLQLDPRTGKRAEADSPLLPLAYKRDIEAPHLVERDGWFYLFLNWGKCCRGMASTYNIRVGRSRQITGPYLDRDGVGLLEGGGTLVLETDGPFIGPGHANISRHNGRDWMHCHFYDGTQRGRSMLAIMELGWDADGWPAVDVSTGLAGHTDAQK